LTADQSFDRARKARLLFVSAKGFGEIADFNDRHSAKSKVQSLKSKPKIPQRSCGI
jgi:hypothetical protein